ncbi:rhodanese-like domain-containing protein [Haloterrigena sp. H1]|uniref:rhodanese-like domain-containing protein n=1 Tax=Haloterrigena sp. H1 TaxID=2552943 RepID=UPI00110E1748|nr:rhodanese-like domain-containing protein [Haloterrigena sp. H1]TMT85287.1 rhodanese-like domain-containing protein [Haloterrigena sp. H1]
MIEEVSTETVRERLERGDEFDLIDIREDEDYAEGHLPEADHVTIEELEEIVETRNWADEVVVYCYRGNSSIQAARLIAEYGDAERVVSMAGGYQDWEPLEAVAAD